MAITRISSKWFFEPHPITFNWMDTPRLAHPKRPIIKGLFPADHSTNLLIGVLTYKIRFPSWQPIFTSYWFILPIYFELHYPLGFRNNQKAFAEKSILYRGVVHGVIFVNWVITQWDLIPFDNWFFQKSAYKQVTLLWVKLSAYQEGCLTCR